jgi:hypothetical protein
MGSLPFFFFSCLDPGTGLGQCCEQPFVLFIAISREVEVVADGICGYYEGVFVERYLISVTVQYCREW